MFAEWVAVKKGKKGRGIESADGLREGQSFKEAAYFAAHQFQKKKKRRECLTRTERGESQNNRRRCKYKKKGREVKKQRKV